ncbi:quinone-dependent dihydroorotate dehydrogenase [Hydrogenimonas thermophila]|uniref:quinone-dependent dihydroorotate dehydrogenase n=1 Tax=Hydrogenimonas thermophila TaxID=223786 RepID=UPI00293745A5|nr:quinone-dependent dihydroorotate dehydrogenase [Hydrogenimonas thermophila]WOE68972.1 quinone-dependent dihydroorotate dehydrogenase [Hydrogenimonas thermophila]WOE71479.1 quinone-dependent dihydroorotate dehydrogenase [Hydrogenimonas thermophila]
MINYEKVKPLFFKLDPEDAHHLVANTLQIGELIPQLFNPFIKKNFVDDERLHQEIFGCKFLNPVGLAAGFDKDAEMIRSMTALGFGYTEVGTVTPKPQPGNPKPRLWRHVKEESLQNAMGFNNKGSFYMQKKLKKRYPYVTPIGVNIGKNKVTPENEALKDYEHGIKAFRELCDYLVINISSPNTPGLRNLQNETFIDALFDMAKSLTNKPILLKIAPDMSKEQAVALCNKAVEAGADGIIATNTSIDYSLVKEPKDVGGISGRVIRDKSFEIFDAIADELYGKTVLISVGGIDSGYEAYRRIRAGANLVQVLTGLIFKGPEIAGNINRTLLKLLEKDGFKNITEAIGADRK